MVLEQILEAQEEPLQSHESQENEHWKGDQNVSIVWKTGH